MMKTINTHGIISLEPLNGIGAIAADAYPTEK